MPKTLLLDANLAILLVVGIVDEGFIAKHKRLSAFDVTDYKILSNIVGASAGLLFCPNIASETSNLLRQTGEPMRSRLSKAFGEILRKVDEKYVESKIAASESDYVRLGVSDAVLLNMARSGSRLLTTDVELYLAAQNAGLDAVNYNHVRDARPDYL